jgi:hypothetical protein
VCEVTTTLDTPIRTALRHDVPKFEYMVVPLQPAKGMKKDAPWIPDDLNEYGADGWDAVGVTLKAGDLVAWPVVLLKRPV